MSSSGAAFLLRWREPLAFGLGALALAWFAWSRWMLGSEIAAAFCLLGALGALAAARVGYQRAKLAGRGDGPGMVVVRERRISYFGPQWGATVDLGSLARVEIERRAPGALWLLFDSDGNLLSIPVSAHGAGALYEAFAPLPGFDWDRVDRALAPGAAEIFPVWEKHR